MKRWEAVAEIEREDMQATSPAEKWQQFGVIIRRAARLGVSRENDDEEMKIFLRWAKLKANHPLD